MTTGRKKLTITEEVLLTYLKTILDIETIDDMDEYYFSQDTLKKKNALKKYHETNMGDYLRKYIVLENCSKLSKVFENDLTEKDLITIIKYIIKPLGYKLLTIPDGNRVLPWTLNILISNETLETYINK